MTTTTTTTVSQPLVQDYPGELSFSLLCK